MGPTQWKVKFAPNRPEALPSQDGGRRRTYWRASGNDSDGARWYATSFPFGNALKSRSVLLKNEPSYILGSQGLLVTDSRADTSEVERVGFYTSLIHHPISTDRDYQTSRCDLLILVWEFLLWCRLYAKCSNWNFKIWRIENNLSLHTDFNNIVLIKSNKRSK